MNQRFESKKAVATAAIGWIVHTGILALVVQFGNTKSYFGFGTQWMPGWIEVTILGTLTLAFVIPYLWKPRQKTRSWLIIPALIHLPFIHFGTWISLFYFFNIAAANSERDNARQRPQ